MSEALPLAAAAERLRRRPGRPPVSDEERTKRATTRETTRAAQLATVTPRLFGVEGAAAYLGGISAWSVRDLHACGRLPRVRLPLGGDRELRRLLFDVRDLDRIIDAAKESA